MGVTGIPTMYAGVRFRSRAEATWAAYFDRLGWTWDYEPVDCRGYIPDFLITIDVPEATGRGLERGVQSVHSFFVEVKGGAATEGELLAATPKIEAARPGRPVFLVGASPTAGAFLGYPKSNIGPYIWREAGITLFYGCTTASVWSCRDVEHRLACGACRACRDSLLRLRGEVGWLRNKGDDTVRIWLTADKCENPTVENSAAYFEHLHGFDDGQVPGEALPADAWREAKNTTQWKPPSSHSLGRCEVCGRPYAEHPIDPRARYWESRKCYHVLCDGCLWNSDINRKVADGQFHKATHWGNVALVRVRMGLDASPDPDLYTKHCSECRVCRRSPDAR
jgi:hypothetical protein